MIAEAKLDKKFTGQVFKVKDGSVVPHDQWLVFLAKDTAFANTLPTYLAECKKLGADSKQIEMVEAMIRHVAAWRALYPDLCKTPDAIGELVLP